MSAATLPDLDNVNSALLIVDLVSDFQFEDGEVLFERSQPIFDRIAKLKQHFEARKAPIVYVNDELEGSTGELSRDIDRLRSRSSEADYVLSRLSPRKGSHWITKPQRSGFFATGLGSLLLSLDVSSVIVTGVTTDICVFFTAHDAYMRGYSVSVPEDCCAAVDDSYHRDALKFLARVAEADTSPLTEHPLMARFGLQTILPELSIGI
jgi:nicotinamidase-related amidase